MKDYLTNLPNTITSINEFIVFLIKYIRVKHFQI